MVLHYPLAALLWLATRWNVRPGRAGFTGRVWRVAVAGLGVAGRTGLEPPFLEECRSATSTLCDCDPHALLLLLPHAQEQLHAGGRQAALAGHYTV